MTGSIELGISPIGWSNDDLPELGGDTPLEACLREARGAGYAGVELGHKFPREATALRDRLAAHDLRLVSGWFSGWLLQKPVHIEMQRIRSHAELLRDLGCHVIVFAEVTGAVHGDRNRSLQQRPRLADDTWRLLTHQLDDLAHRLADTYGLRLAYHHHMGTVVQTAAEIDTLMQRTSEGVGLLLDTGHLTYAGDDPLKILQRHAARVVHVHCKDIRPTVLSTSKATDRSFLDAVIAGVFTVPGDGAIAFEPILRELAQAAYSGWLVVEAEQDPAVAPPQRYAEQAYDFLTTACTNVGLRRP